MTIKQERITFMSKEAFTGTPERIARTVISLSEAWGEDIEVKWMPDLNLYGVFRPATPDLDA